MERRPRADALTREAAPGPSRGPGGTERRNPEPRSSTGSADPAPAPRTLPGPTPRPQHAHTLTGIILDPNRMEAGVWPRPGRAEVAPGVAGPGKPSEDEAAHPAADLLQGSGARIPSADPDAAEPRAHSPRRSRGRDAALSRRSRLPPPPPLRNQLIPAGPPRRRSGPAPSRQAPPAARPEARGRGDEGACADSGGGARRGRNLFAWGGKCRRWGAAELLLCAPPGGAGERAGGRRRRRTIIVKPGDGWSPGLCPSPLRQFRVAQDSPLP